MPSLIPITVALLAMTPAAGSDVPPGLRVAPVRALAGDWIVLRAETDGRVVRWKSLDRGLRIAPPELVLNDARTTLATASRPGKYRVVCVTARGDLPSEIVEFLVEVVPDEPGPEPAPPPTPEDPLARALREAFQADAETPERKRELLAALAAFYSAMARHVKTARLATIGDLLADYRQAMPNLLPENALPRVRRLCGEEVSRWTGTDPARPIDDELRTRLAREFERLAGLLAACGR